MPVPLYMLSMFEKDNFFCSFTGLQVERNYTLRGIINAYTLKPHLYLHLIHMIRSWTLSKYYKEIRLSETLAGINIFCT